MTARPRVVFVASALTLGGTEKMLVSFAKRLDPSRFDVRAVGVMELGPRAAELEAAGVLVDCGEGDRRRLAGLLRGADVVWVFRSGAAEPLVPAACREAGVPHLIEQNIFGQVDRSADEPMFDQHFLVSRMCLLRYRERLGHEPPDFHRRHRVLSAPIELEELRAAAPDPRTAKSRLGLDPERPVVGRIGRAADLKWRNLVVDMVPHLLALVPEAQVLLVGATPEKRRRLQRLGVLDRCVLHEPTLDQERLSTFYAACDVFASASEIGESQGIAIGEALGLGIPVVTSSTPWADNAQVEFVDPGRSGFFASHPRPFAEAVATLLGDPALRASFGAAGKADVERELAPDLIAARVTAAVEALAHHGEPPADWTPSPEDVEAFAREYDRRSRVEFRPLTARERAEALLTRRRERARQVVAVIRARAPALARR